jgi:hypothetical protein
MVFCLPPGEPREADFSSGRWRKAFHPRNFDAVFANLLEFDTLNLGSDIAVVVLWALNLVEELGGHTVDGHDAAGVLFFVHDAFALMIDGADGKAEIEMFLCVENAAEVG